MDRAEEKSWFFYFVAMNSLLWCSQSQTLPGHSTPGSADGKITSLDLLAALSQHIPGSHRPCACQGHGADSCPGPPGPCLQSCFHSPPRSWSSCSPSTQDKTTKIFICSTFRGITMGYVLPRQIKQKIRTIKN